MNYQKWETLKNCEKICLHLQKKITACWITSPYKICYKILGDAATSFQKRNYRLNSAKSVKLETDQWSIWVLLGYIFSIVMGQQKKKIHTILMVYVKIKIHIKKCLYLCKSMLSICWGNLNANYSNCRILSLLSLIWKKGHLLLKTRI